MTHTAPRPRAADATEIVTGRDGAKLRGPDGTWHYLNSTAAAIYALADGTRSARQIADEVAQLFGLEAPPTADVDAALADMADKGLIHPGR